MHFEKGLFSFSKCKVGEKVMASLLKKFTLFYYVKIWFAKKSSPFGLCRNIVVSDIDCGFLPLEVLAQIDYVTMQHMAHISGRKCTAN
jgi:hypothetical protein